MNGYYATGEVWIGDLKTDAEAEEIQHLVECALSGAGYQATVTITAQPYRETP